MPATTEKVNPPRLPNAARPGYWQAVTATPELKIEIEAVAVV